MSNNNYAYLGAEDRFQSGNDFNANTFHIQRVINSISTATLVKVMAVSNMPGQVTSVGTVDVLPLVNLLDGYGNSMPHETVSGLIYFRYAGGQNAILLDPQVGDLGLAIFADRDISSVKSAQKQANPGSRRRFSMSDGIYFGICLGQSSPNQYIQFTNDGIVIHDKNGNIITMSSSGIDCTSARLTCNNAIIAGQGSGDSVTLQHHTHSGVQTGGGNTQPPNSGT